MRVQWRNVHIYDPAGREIRGWPSEVRKELGSVLTLLQMGESVGMPDVKPMPAVAKGAAEIRVKGESGIYRAFFVICSEKGVLVFHGFKKTTQKTPEREIETGKKRLRIFLEELGL